MGTTVEEDGRDAYLQCLNMEPPSLSKEPLHVLHPCLYLGKGSPMTEKGNIAHF